MGGQKSQKDNWARKCNVCDVNFSERNAYILHLVGKRHQKTVRKRDKTQENAARNRTVWLSEAAQTVLRKKNYNIFTSHLTASPMKVQNQDHDREVPISPYLRERLHQAATGSLLDHNISFLIKEIELKPMELRDRESLRRGIAGFLSPHFPRVLGYIFGSSANNLGFSGCDVDIYLDVGIYPWVDCETKAAAQAQGRDLTWFLANRIRRSGKAIKVEAIPRARVPIVKFQDRSSRIMVDLSFRHGMPVHNTRLINQYSQTHPLVRPYLMVIRYWAKVQDVAGGGKPAFLITNYALTMLMIFYLMCRNDPIVPSVASLRNRREYRPIFIGPWDVAFSNNVTEWCLRAHDASVMDLVSEFFSYFGELEASQWVISPLTGMLLARKDVETKSRDLPECLKTYFEQDEVIQLDTELCLQDPFEHTHNCTRGLLKSSFLDFQYKCRTAALISKDILKGEQTLNDLFQPIEIVPDHISDEWEDSSQSREDDEVITLDDSDTSQDIEVLETCKRVAEDANFEGSSDIEILPSPERTPDVEILSDPQGAAQDIEILTGPQKPAQISNEQMKSKEESESARRASDQSETQSHSSVEILKNYKKSSEEVSTDLSSIKGEGSGTHQGKMENNSSTSSTILSNPFEKCSTFLLDYSNVPEFTITRDGNVRVKGSELLEDYDTGQSACLLIQFVLQQCLKMEVSTEEDILTDRKRKAVLESDEATLGKRMQGNDGNSVSVPGKYLKLSKFMCKATMALWIGRKKFSKIVAKKFDETPLQYELAVTEAQIIKQSDLPSDDSLKLTIEVWQEVDHPKMIHSIFGPIRMDPSRLFVCIQPAMATWGEAFSAASSISSVPSTSSASLHIASNTLSTSSTEDLTLQIPRVTPARAALSSGHPSPHHHSPY
ncbi:Speckle targeted PIP5K1A-regulated poly(A) polymerase [Chionoecetes opilio]|uniref:Speckle targeted PIP5K1A-regulated poly(A) polymerase n=1 Tax=Chionoecetes opilio TaxID=41210 RepID=A0A8J5CRH3_CHIOP|nr:Speckle targeted PIP5K1A-regulated poly(A) polymerase [Chionoecetes opilio]